MAATMAATAEELTISVPEMEPKLTYGEPMGYRPELSLNMMNANVNATAEADASALLSTTAAARKNTRWEWMYTKPGVKPYKFMDDMTFVGLPLFAAGLAIKGDKAMFRVNDKANGKKNAQLLSDFKTKIDDYTQYFGPAMVVGLKLGGVEGRSSWGRLLASAGMSYAIMAGLVNGIKYTAKEMRPDGSTANSWPSGHTATSFVGATLLHKEYGLTRSPWFSVAGYGVATATGVMRVLNNRHWVSDVMSGAGIGIVSGELGYALCDLIFKGRGLLRNDLEINNEKPSFFSISMGVGLGNKSIEFAGSDLQDKEFYGPNVDDDGADLIKFRAATVVDAEGAYFFNKYIGVGGRLRVRAMSAKSFGSYADIAGYMGALAWLNMTDAYERYASSIYGENGATFDFDEYLRRLGCDNGLNVVDPSIAPCTNMTGIVKSDHLAEFTGSVGLYFNLPLGKRFSLGSKLLIGRSITQELDIDGYAEGYVKDIEYEATIRNGELALGTDGKPMAQIGYPHNTADNEKYTDQWDFVTLGADNSTSWGTGLSLTYRYKSNFSWRIYIDYDYTSKNYMLTYDPFHFLKFGLTHSAQAIASMTENAAYLMLPMTYKKKKEMHFFTAGLSFLVNL